MSICKNCGRGTCPTLTAPKRPSRHLAPSDETEEQFIARWRAAHALASTAEVNCNAHKVGWFAECLKLREEVKAERELLNMIREDCEIMVKSAEELSNRDGNHRLRVAGMRAQATYIMDLIAEAKKKSVRP